MAADMTGAPSAIARRDVLRLGAGVSLLAMLPAAARAATGEPAPLYKDAARADRLARVATCCRA